MTEQNYRISQALIYGPFTAFCLAGCVFSLLALGYSGQLRDGMISALMMAMLAATGTFLSIFFIWRPAIRRRETRKRGAFFGGLAGCVALMIMTTAWSSYEIIKDLKPNGESAVSVLSTILTVSLAMTLIGFIFGGFMAPGFGALMGRNFSRDPDEPDY